MNYQEKYKQLLMKFGTQQEMAKALGCVQPMVWKYLHGKCYMSAVIALRAEKATNGEFKAVDLCPRLKDL